MAKDRRSLEDPDYARFAWRRFRRILGWMGVAAILAVLTALGWLHWFGGGLTLHLVLATTIGIGLTIMMAAALMGLAFMSSGTGHDEAVDRFGEEER
ncbi:MAG: hypothetical protein ABR601_11225 [Parasphingopyxis sp.]